MLQDSDTYPLGGHMDLSQVRYGMFLSGVHTNGVLTGLAIQDPPLTLVNGVLVGPGMSASVTVPEPGTFVLLSMGLGLMGLVARRRQRNHSARPATLDCAATEHDLTRNIKETGVDFFYGKTRPPLVFFPSERAP